MATYSNQQVQMQYQQHELVLEQNYTVLKDLSNVLGILVEYLAVKETGNERLAAVFLNRLITQINISNAIHYESFCEAQKSGTLQNLNQRKDEAQQIYQTMIEMLKKQQILKENDRTYVELDRLLNIYLTVNLSKNQVLLKQTEINPSKENTQLTEQSLQKIVDAMNQTDTVFDKVQNGKMQLYSKEEQSKLIFPEVMQRYQNAQQRLQQNPNQQNTQNNQSSGNSTNNIPGVSKINNQGNNQQWNNNNGTSNQGNNNQGTQCQISQETKQLLQVMIQTLYNSESKDYIYNVLAGFDERKRQIIYQELCHIYHCLQSQQMKQNFYEIGEVIYKKKSFWRNNFKQVGDKLDFAYLTDLANGIRYINK